MPCEATSSTLFCALRRTDEVAVPLRIGRIRHEVPIQFAAVVPPHRSTLTQRSLSSVDGRACGCQPLRILGIFGLFDLASRAHQLVHESRANFRRQVRIGGPPEAASNYEIAPI